MKKIVMGLAVGAMTLSFALPARAEPQPRMREALDALRAAREKLVRAEQNKGGHRDRAIQHVDQAIHEVEEGIRYANEHH